MARSRAENLKKHPSVPRLAYTVDEVCTAANCSRSFYEKSKRLGTATPLWANCATRVLKKAQTFFELGLLLGDLASQYRGQLFVQMPQFIYGHGTERFHEMDPPVLFLPSA